jgi:hypothetical protein
LVEHSIAGDEPRAIKRYDFLRRPLTLAQFTRQAINDIVWLAGTKTKLGRVWLHMLRHGLWLLPRRYG